MAIIQPPKPGLPMSPAIRAIHNEGDDLAKRLAAMNQVKGSDVFKEANPLDAHLFTLQMETMQAYLHILTIRLARANDAAKGLVLDNTPTLGSNFSLGVPKRKH